MGTITVCDLCGRDAEIAALKANLDQVYERLYETQRKDLAAVRAGMVAALEAEVERLATRLATADERTANVEGDNERLKDWVNDLHSGMYINCVYCGHRYGPADDVPSTMSQVLYDHIAICPEHPLSEARAEIAALKAEVERLGSEHHCRDEEETRNEFAILDALSARSEFLDIPFEDACRDKFPEFVVSKITALKQSRAAVDEALDALHVATAGALWVGVVDGVPYVGDKCGRLSERDLERVVSLANALAAARKGTDDYKCHECCDTGWLMDYALAYDDLKQPALRCRCNPEKVREDAEGEGRDDG